MAVRSVTKTLAGLMSAVNDPAGMGCVRATAHFNRQSQQSSRFRAVARRCCVLERQPFRKLHDDEGLAILFIDFM